jgi:hypothetical protein
VAPGRIEHKEGGANAVETANGESRVRKVETEIELSCRSKFNAQAPLAKRKGIETARPELQRGLTIRITPPPRIEIFRIREKNREKGAEEEPGLIGAGLLLWISGPVENSRQPPVSSGLPS